MGTCSVCEYVCMHARAHTNTYTHHAHIYIITDIPTDRFHFRSRGWCKESQWSFSGGSVTSDIATDDPFHRQGSTREQTILKHPCLPADFPYYPRNSPVSTDCLQNRTPGKGKRATLGISPLLHSAAVCTGFCPFLEHLSSCLPGS